jgi:hypothetical protein
MLSGIDDPGESRMGEISMSGSTREREAAVIGLRAFHPVLSSLLYRLRILVSLSVIFVFSAVKSFGLRSAALGL